MATTTSTPSSADSRARSSASVGEPGQIETTSEPRLSIAMMSRCEPPVNWEAAGLAITTIRCIGGREYPG